MATYYVRPDGNNSNTGTGASAGQAWQTVVYALGSTSAGGSGLVAGDVLYIAPGVYRGAITLGMASAASTISIIGDPLCTQFAGVSAGEIILTVATTDAVISNSTLISATAKNFISWQGILFDNGSATIGINMSGCLSWTFTKCTFTQAAIPSYTPQNIQAAYGAGVVANLTIDRCSCFGGGLVLLLNTNHTSSTNVNVVVKDVFCLGPLMRQAGANSSASTNATGFTVYNCTTLNTLGGILSYSTVSGAVVVRNSVFIGASSLESAGLNGNISEDFNRFYSASPRATVPSGANSAVGYHSLETLNRPLSGLPFAYVGASALDGANYNSGTLTGAPTFDLFTNNWVGINPDRGAIRWIGANGVSPFIPTERNASTITIAPSSTSQSIELYLGATGLTASTSGLSAYYNRTRSADVQINLQARNITQNWTSGGFAEVNPNTMPGVYRLDIPNEALAAGADDVTVVVRGASGTNGAVMSIKLSSGGLTSSQTASAVWNALTNDHTTHGTFGWNVLRADQDSKEGLVTLHQSGGVSRVDADIHAVANDTAAATALKGALLHDGTGYVDSDVVRVSTSVAAANELEGALLHNGTDYIDSNLIGGAATRVFVGRFQMTQTGTTQGDIIEAFTTDTPAFELQLFDGDNNLVPVTGATLGLRILDVTSTVVETGTPTIEYGTGGIVRWTAPGTYLSIGCPAGMYRLFVDRTVSGTTTTFGPLQIKVQVQ